MTEREIRQRISELCEELDRRARRVVRKVVLPTVLGAGLAVSFTCCDKTPIALPYGVPDDWRTPIGDVNKSADQDKKQSDKQSADVKKDGGGDRQKTDSKVDVGGGILYAAPDCDSIG